MTLPIFAVKRLALSGDCHRPSLASRRRLVIDDNMRSQLVVRAIEMAVGHRLFDLVQEDDEESMVDSANEAFYAELHNARITLEEFR